MVVFGGDVVDAMDEEPRLVLVLEGVKGEEGRGRDERVPLLANGGGSDESGDWEKRKD